MVLLLEHQRLTKWQVHVVLILESDRVTGISGIRASEPDRVAGICGITIRASEPDRVAGICAITIRTPEPDSGSSPRACLWLWNTG